MPLSETELKKYNKYLAATAVAQKMEIDVFIAKFNEIFDQLAGDASLRNKPRHMIYKRARSAINAAFSNDKQEGDEFVFFLFGPLGERKDWNESLFEHIEGEIGRNNIKGLVADGRVMTMESDGKKIPVAEVTKYELVERFVDTSDGSIHTEDDKEGLTSIKEFVVTDGIPYKKGVHDSLIYRDHRVMKGDSVNYGWSKMLVHNYQINFMGIACMRNQVNTDQADWRLIDLTVRGSQADIDDKNFILKNYDPFQCYVGNFKVDEKRTFPWRYGLSAKNVVATGFDNPFKYDDGTQRAIDDVIEELFGVIKDQCYQEAIKTKVSKNSFDMLPDFLDGFSEIAEYHSGTANQEKWDKAAELYELTKYNMETTGKPKEIPDELLECGYSNLFSGQAVKDDSGKIMKSPSGWDKRVWNKWAIMRADVTGLFEPKKEGGNCRYELSDSMVKNPMTVWASNYTFKQPKPIPSTCLLMIQTQRRPDRWDIVSKQRVQDPDNGELSIELITISNIPEMEDVDVPAINMI